MFEDTCAEDKADLQAQLLGLQASEASAPAGLQKTPRQPRCQKLPEHLRRSIATSRRTPPAAAESPCSAWARA